MKRITSSLANGLALGLALLGVSCGVEPVDSEDIDTQASALITRTAVMRDAFGRQVGTVTFAETAQGRVRISANFNFSASPTQVREGFHGFHIHANNNPANGSGCIADPNQPAATHFVSVDGHYNGGTHNAHAGDMPSPFFLNDGIAVMSFERRLDINDIANRGVILHVGIDNFNNIPLGPNPDQYTANSQAAIDLTAATGNAGARQACGIIQ
jgi:superoxide dismutase, Cu-Zn family